MVVLDELDARVFAPMERRKNIDAWAAELTAGGKLPRFEDALVREIERRVATTPVPVTIGPIEDHLGATNFAGLQELSGMPPLGPPDALARFEAVIRSEIERRDRGVCHGTDR